MDKKVFRKFLRECIVEVITENLGEDQNNPLYVEYLKPMSNEEPFMMNGEKFEYCWAKYPNGKVDIGVYAYSGDVCYGYNAFRQRYNLPENSEPVPQTEPSTKTPSAVPTGGISPETPYGVMDIQTKKIVYKTTYANRNRAKRFADKKDLEYGAHRYQAFVIKNSVQEGDIKCAWCGAHLGTSDKFDGTSHNICPKCKEDMMKDSPATDPSKSELGLSEMTGTSAVQGFYGKNWVDPDPDRKKMKSLAVKSVGGKVA